MEMGGAWGGPIPVGSAAGLAETVRLGPFSQPPRSHQHASGSSWRASPLTCQTHCWTGTFHKTRAGGCLRDGWELAAMTSLFRVQLSFCLGSLSFSSKTLTQQGRPLSSPCPARGVRPLVNCNPQDTPRMEAAAPGCPPGRPLCVPLKVWRAGPAPAGTVPVAPRRALERHGLCVLCLCSLKGCGWFTPEGHHGCEKSPRRALILNFGPVTPLLHTSASD